MSVLSGQKPPPHSPVSAPEGVRVRKFDLASHSYVWVERLMLPAAEQAKYRAELSVNSNGEFDSASPVWHLKAYRSQHSKDLRWEAFELDTKDGREKSIERIDYR